MKIRVRVRGRARARPRARARARAWGKFTCGGSTPVSVGTSKEIVSVSPSDT